MAEALVSDDAFWVDQLKMLQRARMNAVVSDASQEILDALEVQINDAATRIEGDVDSVTASQEGTLPSMDDEPSLDREVRQLTRADFGVAGTLPRAGSIQEARTKDDMMILGILGKTPEYREATPEKRAQMHAVATEEFARLEASGSESTTPEPSRPADTTPPEVGETPMGETPAASLVQEPLENESVPLGGPSPTPRAGGGGLVQDPDAIDSGVSQDMGETPSSGGSDGGQSYAQTKQSVDTTGAEWRDMFKLMREKNIKGFNWAGHSFRRDDTKPSGYASYFDRGVAKNSPEGA